MPSLDCSSLRTTTSSDCVPQRKGPCRLPYSTRPDRKLCRQRLFSGLIFRASFLLNGRSNYSYLKMILCKSYVEASLECLVVQVKIPYGFVEPLPG